MNSDTRIDPNDPRLSAYVLDELSAEEALVVEAQLRRSPEAQAEIEGLDEMAELLRSSFSAELSAAPAAERPTLSVLPFNAEEHKVVSFDNAAVNSKGGWMGGRRVASFGALAAAITLGIFVIPEKSNERGKLLVSAPVTAETPQKLAAAPQETQTVLAQPEGQNAEAVALPTKALRLEPLPRTQMLGGAAVLAGASPALGTNGMFLGNDPSITKVKFLADDATDLQSVPLPAELLSYLDQGIYPNPELVHRQVKLTGGVFAPLQDEPELDVKAEPRRQIDGVSWAVFEDGTVARTPIGENEKGFNLELEPLSFSTGAPLEDDMHFIPSKRLPETDQTIGTESELPEVEEEVGGIEARYILRMEDRVFRAHRLAEDAIKRLELGDLGSAASKLEIALQILPDAPVTVESREVMEQWLEHVHASSRKR